MFGFLRRKKDNFDDMRNIKDQIIGNEPEPIAPPSLSPIGSNLDDKIKNDIEPIGFRRERFMGKPEPIPEVPRNENEILDRLSFIENQLTAIRSQVETINERIKNIQNELSRRY